MPVVEAEPLESFTRHALESYGATRETAETVAASLVDAELVGHASHGVVRVPYFAEDVTTGRIDPSAEPNVESAGPFHQVGGGAALGQLAGLVAVDLLVEAASEHGVAAVGIRDSGHLGRIGEWAERVTAEGLLSASWVNLQGGSQRIAPPGTADRRLGTNPTTFGVPSFDALPFDLIYDGATSQVLTERSSNGTGPASVCPRNGRSPTPAIRWNALRTSRTVTAPCYRWAGARPATRGSASQR
jgi:uncharacterized oxidoreductase